MTTQEYIRLHANDDVRQLALRGAKDEAVDLPFALDQIRGRQLARVKLPSWAALEGIIYPPHLSMEQCSSEVTARYKVEVLVNVGKWSEEDGRFVDLTGGFGVDFSFLSRCFSERVYVERDAELCRIARHNMQLYRLDATIVNADGTDYLRTMPPADVVFIDPARRDGSGRRTYALADCTPNVLEMLPLLMQKTRRIILKLSPMLDWRKAVRDVLEQGTFPRSEERGMRSEEQGTFSRSEERGMRVDVHIVSVDNECKELLLDISPTASSQIYCVNFKGYDGYDVQRLVFTEEEEAEARRHQLSILDIAAYYLFEPNASIMKAGCFATLCQQFNIRAIDANSHLFVGEKPVPDFPGRQFRIKYVRSMNKKELREALAGIDRANISVRNFPLSAEALRRRLKLKDGGDVFIFGTTWAGSCTLFICKKVKS